MKRTGIFLTAIASAALLAGAAFAQPGPGMGMGDGPGMSRRGDCPAGKRMGRRGGAHMMMQRRIMALDLSADQISKIKAIRTDVQKQVIKKQADIKVAELDLRDEMTSTSPSKSKVNGLVKKIGDLKTDVRLLRTDCQLQVRGVLTAEQLKKFLDPTWHPFAKDGVPGSRMGRGAGAGNGMGRMSQ